MENKQISLKFVIDKLREYQNKIFGCGNGRVELEKCIKEIEEKYAD